MTMMSARWVQWLLDEKQWFEAVSAKSAKIPLSFCHYGWNMDIQLHAWSWRHFLQDRTLWQVFFGVIKGKYSSLFEKGSQEKRDARKTSSIVPQIGSLPLRQPTCYFLWNRGSESDWFRVSTSLVVRIWIWLGKDGVVEIDLLAAMMYLRKSLRILQDCTTTVIWKRLTIWSSFWRSWKLNINNISYLQWPYTL